MEDVDAYVDEESYEGEEVVEEAADNVEEVEEEEEGEEEEAEPASATTIKDSTAAEAETACLSLGTKQSSTIFEFGEDFMANTFVQNTVAETLAKRWSAYEEQVVACEVVVELGHKKKGMLRKKKVNIERVLAVGRYHMWVLSRQKSKKKCQEVCIITTASIHKQPNSLLTETVLMASKNSLQSSTILPSAR